jgi:hypothetical protein
MKDNNQAYYYNSISDGRVVMLPRPSLLNFDLDAQGKPSRANWEGGKSFTTIHTLNMVDQYQHKPETVVVTANNGMLIMAATSAGYVGFNKNPHYPEPVECLVIHASKFVVIAKAPELDKADPGFIF